MNAAMIEQKNTQFQVVLNKEKDSISIVAVTWNMHGIVPPLNALLELYHSETFQPLPDAIFFGTQECQKQLWLTFCCQAKDEWQEKLREVFVQYEIISSQVMRGMHTAILIQKKFVNFCTIVKKDKLRAGFYNLMGNKGAISIEIILFGRYIQIINCHLAPHQTQSELRNLTINRIMDNFLTKGLQSQIVFLGDFNYRIDMNKKQYQMMIKNKVNTEKQMNYSRLLSKEQLINQKSLRQRFLQQFYEGAIQFPPTYKMGQNDSIYCHRRIPGWTDRIFAKQTSTLRLISYKCQYDILGCDHRPVLARYEIKIDKNYNIFASRPSKTINTCQLI